MIVVGQAMLIVVRWLLLVNFRQSFIDDLYRLIFFDHFLVIVVWWSLSINFCRPLFGDCCLSTFIDCFLCLLLSNFRRPFFYNNFWSTIDNCFFFVIVVDQLPFIIVWWLLSINFRWSFFDRCWLTFVNSFWPAVINHFSISVVDQLLRTIFYYRCRPAFIYYYLVTIVG